jgi:hypothetical protein
MARRRIDYLATESSDRLTKTLVLPILPRHQSDNDSFAVANSLVQPWVSVVGDNIINRKVLVRNMPSMACLRLFEAERNGV